MFAEGHKIMRSRELGSLIHILCSASEGMASYFGFRHIGGPAQPAGDELERGKKTETRRRQRHGGRIKSARGGAALSFDQPAIYTWAGEGGLGRHTLNTREHV